MPTTEIYRVGAEDAGTRLDVFVTSREEQLSRSFVQKLIGDGAITVNQLAAQANYRVKAGDSVAVSVPPPVELQVCPESIPLDIYYEDSDVIVVNKPRGMVVHPAEGNYTGTLVNALLEHCRDLSGINGVLRPGIVHRIDKDTSGLLMVAKNDLAHEHLAGQLKKHTVRRGYVALIHGVLASERGVVDAPIGRDPRDRQKMTVTSRNSKPAVTHYRVLERAGNYTFLRLRLETGRTHQIRVHMAYIGNPLVGDTRYGPGKPHFGLAGQFLHAYQLGFIHPRRGDYLEFRAPLPAELGVILQKLGIDEKIT
ncbi:Ribosomal large subunit pseudouridine synthase D [Sporotomaculum syntrophicum]|uniref:Pseudouridine synthase n=1 Tax=Sporotomaculum syntrophicum TaxID=182264 RepID=A0A9D2WQN3_9FIRM|nr:RluA family pseudouridine synthase [Sporotomaculum syntrophicum]KAF1085583.1 Ribosomal large subunit pseudouridine synthase D [Sporotomaculum syntrophicum]